jgi:hypothetical protein
MLCVVTSDNGSENVVEALQTFCEPYVTIGHATLGLWTPCEVSPANFCF